MDLRAELYNTNGDTTNDSPSLIFLLIYLCFLGLWVFICLRNNPYVHRIHVLMGALLAMVMLDLICGPPDKQYVKITSNADNHTWDVLIYILKSFRLVFFYTVIVLVSAGWSFVELRTKEKIASMIGILFNVAFEVIMESNHFHKDEADWNYATMAVETFIPYIVLFTICIVNETKLQPMVSPMRLLIPVTLYGFLLRDAVYIAKIVEVDSVSNATCNTAKEILSLVFCMVMFCMFRPAQKNVVTFYMFRRIEEGGESCVVDVEKNEYSVVHVEDEVEVARSAKRKKRLNGPKTQKNRCKRAKKNYCQVHELVSRLEREVKELEEMQLRIETEVKLREEMEARLHQQMLQLANQFMQSGKPQR